MITRRTMLALSAPLALAGTYHAVRPRLLHWGATPDEVTGSLPGDDLVPDPHLTTTRAVSIAAGPEHIWPWLAQLGDGRGGLYSYDWLDRAFGYLSGPSADRILPEFQNLRPGDIIPLGRGLNWPVAIADRNRALVVDPVPGTVSWCWAIIPEDGGTSRLISRVRVRIWNKPLLLLAAPFVDGPWFVMERRMLLGIKARAEQLALLSGPSPAHPAPVGLSR